MAKKTKRKVSSGMRPVVDGSTPVVESAGRDNGPASATAFRRTTSYSAEFNPDYTYVIKDLKRIGILAGSFLGVLIILSFFIK